LIHFLNDYINSNPRHVGWCQQERRLTASISINKTIHSQVTPTHNHHTKTRPLRFQFLFLLFDESPIGRSWNATQNDQHYLIQNTTNSLGIST